MYELEETADRLCPGALKCCWAFEQAGYINPVFLLPGSKEHDRAIALVARFAPMWDKLRVHREHEQWTTIVFFFLSGIITASPTSRIPDVQQRLAVNSATWVRILPVQPADLSTGLTYPIRLVAWFGSRRIMVIHCIGWPLMQCAGRLAGICTWMIIGRVPPAPQFAIMADRAKAG